MAMIASARILPCEEMRLPVDYCQKAVGRPRLAMSLPKIRYASRPSEKRNAEFVLGFVAWLQFVKGVVA